MKQKRTILFLVRLYHPHIGGVEKHVERIIPLLRAAGYTIVILTEQFDSALPMKENYRGVEIIRIPVSDNSFTKKFGIWKWVIANFSLFYKFDIIHVHDVFFWILPFRLFLITKKIFITFHGYEGYPIKMRWVIVRKISEIFSNGSICVGSFMKKWYHAKSDIVIYGAVEEVKKTNMPISPTAVFFGRLDEQTGILEYTDAYKLIKERFPKFKLTIIGDGELKTHIAQEIKIIPFTKEVSKYISENRFIFVSRYLSMLEALIQKREIIAVYDNPVKKDYLVMSPFNRYVSVVKNSQEIAEIVIKSLQNPHSNTANIEKGYLWAKEQTWEKIANAYLKLWGENLL